MATVKIDADKLTALAEKIPKVYESGKKGDNYEAGRKAEHDAFWNMVQDNGNRDNYANAFINWGAEYIRPLYKVIPTHISGASQMFYCAYRLKKIEKIYFDFSQKQQGTGAYCGYYYMFGECTSLEEIEDIGFQAEPTSDYETYTSTFYNCSRIHTIAVIRSSENTKFINAFIKCDSLQNINIEGVIGQNGVDLRYSKNLSKASITSVMKALSTAAEEKTVTLSLAAVNNAFETSEGVADGSESEEWLTLAATRANWTISLIDG